MQNSQWHVASCRWTWIYRSQVGNRRYDAVSRQWIWDLADIYGPAEDFIGQFRHKLLALRGKEKELNKIQALTKWVPQPQIITRSMVNESIQRSLHRMDVIR